MPSSFVHHNDSYYACITSYLEEDFVSSDEDYFHDLIRTIDRTKYAKTQDFVNQVQAGVPFSDMITKEVKPDRKVLGEAIILEGVKQFPARIKCAMLSWKAIYQLIEKYEGKGEKND